MAREPRVLSKSQTYHVMNRGIEKKRIFLDDLDRIKFLEILRKKKMECEYLVYAYCLMDNHVHLVIKEGTKPISHIMKRINTSYARYFNQKYDRAGYLFQNRFKSEAIENESYLLTVIKYVHDNPVKAGLVQNPRDYSWSSFNVYTLIGSDQIVERKEILGLFSSDEGSAIKLFCNYSSKGSQEDVINGLDKISELKTVKPELIIHEFIAAHSLSELREILCNRDLRNELLRQLKEKTGLSIRDISVLLGVDRNVVQRA